MPGTHEQQRLRNKAAIDLLTVLEAMSDSADIAKALHIAIIDRNLMSPVELEWLGKMLSRHAWEIERGK